MATGWEPERRTHFDEIVVGYDRIRPEYPSEIFADITQYAGRKQGAKALEIGAGTGKATAPFLRAGYDVTAVEIGGNMTDFLRERFEGDSNFRVILSSFEEAPLQDSTYDLVYAASAFHWVDAAVGCPKVLRLLTKGGVCALIRYNAPLYPPAGENLGEAFRALYEEHYYSYYELKYRPVPLTHELLGTQERILTGYGCKDLRDYGFVDISMRFYDMPMHYTADEYIVHLDTLSDHRALPEKNRMALYSGIRETIIAHGDHHTVDYIFQLYMGRKGENPQLHPGC